MYVDRQLPGYYIHTCQKMRYKGAFRPQYVLGKVDMGSVKNEMLIGSETPRATPGTRLTGS